MQSRLDYKQVPSGAAKVMRDLQRYVDTYGLEPALLELVELRASQINGSAFCIDMHTKDARAMGETEQRLTPSVPGMKRRSTRTVSGPPWRGPTP